MRPLASLTRPLAEAMSRAMLLFSHFFPASDVPSVVAIDCEMFHNRLTFCEAVGHLRDALPYLSRTMGFPVLEIA